MHMIIPATTPIVDKKVRECWLTAQGAQGERRDEVMGGRGHHDLYLGTRLHQGPHQKGGFESCYATRDPEQNTARKDKGRGHARKESA